MTRKMVLQFGSVALVGPAAGLVQGRITDRRHLGCAPAHPSPPPVK
jgi:hypothetical protein